MVNKRVHWNPDDPPPDGRYVFKPIPLDMLPPVAKTPTQRLRAIAQILEDVDNRCMAVDGPVDQTRDEITDEEYRRIYVLATHKIRKIQTRKDARRKRRHGKHTK